MKNDCDGRNLIPLRCYSGDGATINLNNGSCCFYKDLFQARKSCKNNAKPHDMSKPLILLLIVSSNKNKTINVLFFLFTTKVFAASK